MLVPGNEYILVRAEQRTQDSLLPLKRLVEFQASEVWLVTVSFIQ